VKVVLLAGGLGTRISEESQYQPKPMIEIWAVFMHLLMLICLQNSINKEQDV